MDKVSIKKEVDEDNPYSVEPTRSSASIYADTVRSSAGIYTAPVTSTGSLMHHHPPTQRVSPTSTPPSVSRALAAMVPSLVDSTMSLSPPGGGSDYQRSVYKLKRFLSTLIKFGTDISSPVGDKVREMIFNLVSGLLSVSDFHRQLQEVTNFPVRPYVLPFLHSNVPLLQREIQSVALASNKKVLDYLRLHEQSIFQPALEPGLAEPNDIFHSEAVESHHRKRRTSSNSDLSPLTIDLAANSLLAAKRAKLNPNMTGLGHLSPPLYHSNNGSLTAGGLFPRKDMFSGGINGSNPVDGRKWSSVYPGKLAIVPGCPSNGSAGSGGGGTGSNSSIDAVKAETGGLGGGGAGGSPGGEEEWKNVQVMLNCILGMVEKTQRAITILQQRQQSSSQQFNNQRSPEDIIDEVQTSAVRAVNEVKQNALTEISRARQELMLLRRGAAGSSSGAGRDKDTASGLLRISTSQSETSEICWNCGRLGSETCSGCKIAKYCGSFCQHKDWESHHRICRSAVQEQESSTAVSLAASASHSTSATTRSSPIGNGTGPLDLNCNKTSLKSMPKVVDNDGK